jgi:RNA polymerase sigma-70 factor (ECF subfamily)
MARRNNGEWLDDLRGGGEAREAALADLRQIILEGLPYALSGWLSRDDERFAALTEETAQETLLRVLSRLDTFEGRSQFTTWAHKIAVRIALTELRRKRWENVSLEALAEGEEGFNAAPGVMRDAQAAQPERLVESGDLMQRVQRIIAEELTEKQRQAMAAVAVQGMPLEEAARRLGTNRNTLYKLLHDARLRVKRRLAREGLTPEDALAAFEGR